jgi:hypothetical protein
VVTAINILLGLAIHALGCFLLWLTYKFPTKNDYTATNMKGYMGGFFCILFGFLFLLGWIDWSDLFPYFKK